MVRYADLSPTQQEFAAALFDQAQKRKAGHGGGTGSRRGLVPVPGKPHHYVDIDASGDRRDPDNPYAGMVYRGARDEGRRDEGRREGGGGLRFDPNDPLLGYKSKAEREREKLKRVAVDGPRREWERGKTGGDYHKAGQPSILKGPFLNPKTGKYMSTFGGTQFSFEKMSPILKRDEAIVTPFAGKGSRIEYKPPKGGLLWGDKPRRRHRSSSSSDRCRPRRRSHSRRCDERNFLVGAGLDYLAPYAAGIMGGQSYIRGPLTGLNPATYGAGTGYNPLLGGLGGGGLGLGQVLNPLGQPYYANQSNAVVAGPEPLIANTQARLTGAPPVYNGSTGILQQAYNQPLLQNQLGLAGAFGIPGAFGNNINPGAFRFDPMTGVPVSRGGFADCNVAPMTVRQINGVYYIWSPNTISGGYGWHDLSRWNSNNCDYSSRHSRRYC